MDTDISTGWRANQTLNTGNLPQNQYQQQVSGVTTTRQWGIRVSKIILESVSTGSVAGVVTVSDPVDSTILWTVGVATTTQQAGTVVARDDFEMHMPAWRDFKVVGLTATQTKIYIWYRS